MGHSSQPLLGLLAALSLAGDLAASVIHQDGFEPRFPAADVVVGNGPGSCTFSALENAINTASDGQVIGFNCGDNTTISVTNTLEIRNKSLTLDGGGNPQLSLDGQSTTRLFWVQSGGLTLRNLRLINGHNSDTSSGRGGGALYIFRSTVQLQGVELRGNTSASSGGVLYSFEGHVSLEDCTITENQSYGGGALRVQFANLTLRRCTVQGNTTLARNEPGLYGTGGAIYTDFNAASQGLRIEASRFAANQSFNQAGAVGVYGTGFVQIHDSTFVDNHARYTDLPPTPAGSGGALFSSDNITVTIHNSAFAQNRADYEGGAGFIKGDATFNTVSFLANTSGLVPAVDNGGGALILFGYQSIALNTVTFANNLANHANGGAIWVAGSSTSGMSAHDVIFYRNCSNEFSAAGSNNCEFLVHLNGKDSGIHPIPGTGSNYEWVINADDYTGLGVPATHYPTIDNVIVQDVNVRDWVDNNQAEPNHPCSEVTSGAGGAC